jgi:thiol-disulfide isomerase/thioredoxin
MPSPWRLAQLLVVILALLAPLSGCKRNTTPVPPGDVAASLALPSLGENSFDPQTLKGKPSLVMFVTPTCPHCLATLPRGAAAAQATGANLVAVFVAGGKQNAEGVVSHLKWPGIALVDEEKLMIKKYEIKGVPYSVVLGADGRAREAFRGEQEEKAFREALADAR